MAIADRVRLAGGLEARERRGPHRLQRSEPDPGVAGAIVAVQQAVFREPDEAVEHVDPELVRRDRTPSPPGRGRSCPRRRRCGRTAAAPAARAGRRTRRSHPRASAGGSAGRAGRSRAAAGARRAGRGSRGSGSVPTRAAVSSMPSGRPSSSRQMSPMAASSAGVRWRSGRTARARSRNSRFPSPVPPANGPTGNSCSPATRNGARLATTMARRGAARRRSPTVAAAARTCSKLSSRSSVVRSARWSSRRSAAAPRTPSYRPSVRAIVALTRDGSRMGDRSMSQQPSG